MDRLSLLANSPEQSPGWSSGKRGGSSALQTSRVGKRASGVPPRGLKVARAVRARWAGEADQGQHKPRSESAAATIVMHARAGVIGTIRSEAGSRRSPRSCLVIPVIGVVGKTTIRRDRRVVDFDPGSSILELYEFLLMAGRERNGYESPTRASHQRADGAFCLPMRCCIPPRLLAPVSRLPIPGARLFDRCTSARAPVRGSMCGPRSGHRIWSCHSGGFR